VAERLFYEDRVTRACGADTVVRVFAALSAGIAAVTALTPREEENQGTARSEGRVRFLRSGRLLRHADFERVYKQGRRHFSQLMTVFYLQRPPAAGDQSAKGQHVVKAASGMRVGFTVGRALGGAVQRNRMKRRLREAVRLSRNAPGPSVDVVINPKKSLLTAEFAAVVNEVTRAFVVIEQKLGAVPAAAENLRKPESGGRKPN
jgi:ribonuclease P protein component